MRVVWLAAALSLVAPACDRGRPRERPPAPATPRAPGSSGAAGGAAAPPAGEAAAGEAAAAAGGACRLPARQLRRPMPKRLVAIGDLHGDLGGARAALRAAGAIDAQDRWIGGELVVVQTGDVLDRGDDEQAILDLLARLADEARAAGGAVISLIGNHELMNAAGDFRYVTPGAMHDFDDAPGVDAARYARAPAEVRGRISALGPGGAYARRIAGEGVVAIVGDTVFSHAGVLGDWVAQVDEINRSARCWLDGQAGGVADAPLVLTSDTSPVWTRALGVASADCDAAKAALAALGATRMVVGHTVQPGGVNGACGGAVWRIDVGLARVYGGPIQVLELSPDRPPRVLTGAR